MNPTTTIKTLLLTTLNEDFPFLTVQGNLIKAITEEEYLKTSQTALQQLQLIKEVVRNLRFPIRVMPLNFSSIPSLSTSNSSDSFHTDTPSRDFGVSLASLDASSEQETTADIITTIAKAAILKIAGENTDLEKYYKQTLCLALEYHANTIIKNLSQKIPIKTFSRPLLTPYQPEKYKILKQFEISVIEALLNFWVDPKNDNEMTFNADTITENNLHLLHAHKLDGRCNVVEIHQDFILRKIKALPYETLGHDIARHLRHITVFTNKGGPLSFNKAETDKKLKDSDKVVRAGEEFKMMLDCFLSQISTTQSLNHLILKNFDVPKKSKKNFAEKHSKISMSNFAEACSTFINRLTTIEYIDQSKLSNKLLGLLQTIGQSTYVSFSHFLVRYFESFQFNTKQTDDARKIEFRFTKKIIILNSITTAISEHKIKLFITNTMACSIKDTTDWSSKISIEYEVLGSNFEELKVTLINPLMAFGFEVTPRIG
jgi:hypothetical protein